MHPKDERGTEGLRELRGKHGGRPSGSKALRSTRRDRTANKGPLDYKSYHRTREHADGIDAPTRTVTPRRWTAER